MQNQTSKIKSLIKKTNGRFYVVVFQKKDGTLRTMLTRTGVHKGVKGTGKPLPEDSPIVRCYDIKKQAWRSFDCNRVLMVKCGVIEYRKTVYLIETCIECGEQKTRPVLFGTEAEPRMCYDCFTRVDEPVKRAA